MLISERQSPERQEIKEQVRGCTLPVWLQHFPGVKGSDVTSKMPNYFFSEFDDHPPPSNFFFLENDQLQILSKKQQVTWLIPHTHTYTLQVDWNTHTCMTTAVIAVCLQQEREGAYWSVLAGL